MLVIPNNILANGIQYLAVDKTRELLSNKHYRIIGYTNILNKGDNQRDQNTIYFVQPGDSLYQIARKFNTTVAEIKAVNNLQSDVIYVGQRLYIPGRGSDTPPEMPDNDSQQSYLVQPGDSLYQIARKFNTTVAEIKAVNNLQSDVIYVGQRLNIPGTGSGNSGGDTADPEVPGNDSDAPYSEEGIVYFVRPGDSLYLISLKFKTTVEKIRTFNSLVNNALYVGQMLYITSRPANNDQLIYFVNSGDTLSRIAAHFNTTAQAIKEQNNLNSDTLLTGQKLYIKFPDIQNKNFNLVLDYSVEAGNNIDTIASRFNTSAWDIRLYNNLTSDILQPGQVLKIPLMVPDEELKEGMDITTKELDLLARAVFSEARGEPFAGQVAVAGVILNRVRSEFFPNTIEGVIFQPWQFTAVEDGQFWLEPNQVAYIAARAALEGWDPSRGAIYYYNPDMAVDDWIFYRDVIVEIGDHYFAVSI
jgi:LysM repeat protein